MKLSGLSESEARLNLEVDQETDPTAPRSGIGIFLADPLNRRLIEGASTQIELAPTLLNETQLDPDELNRFEMVVADEPIAAQIRIRLADRERLGERVNPAVIAVRQPNADGNASSITPDDKENGFDGVLRLPMQPAAVAAQLSLILYAHRSFASRYESALEELHLNRRIFRSVTSGISVAHATLPDMPLVYVNPAFEVMTGYRLEEVQGRNCRFLQGSDTDQPGLTLIRDALREQREVTAIVKNYRKDGSPFWNELSLSPIRNRSGQLTHFVGIQTDVTARVEFEAALRESEKLAAVGRLASTIAHEINNPLESVTNLLYLARHANTTEDIMRYLSVADKELQRVALITSQSLRFYKQSTRPQAIGCTEMLNSVLDLYESRAEHAHIRISRRNRAQRPVVCLESEIRQVLNNLIRNAIEAMNGAEGNLIIRTRNATNWQSGVRGVLMTVADTGSGISQQTMQHLFKPFFTTKGLAGTGLGLWVSSEIVSRHQGRLLVRSSQRQPYRGTVFQFFLPFQAVVS